MGMQKRTLTMKGLLTYVVGGIIAFSLFLLGCSSQSGPSLYQIDQLAASDNQSILKELEENQGLVFTNEQDSNGGDHYYWVGIPADNPFESMQTTGRDFYVSIFDMSMEVRSDQTKAVSRDMLVQGTCQAPYHVDIMLPVHISKGSELSAADTIMQACGFDSDSVLVEGMLEGISFDSYFRYGRCMIGDSEAYWIIELDLDRDPWGASISVSSLSDSGFDSYEDLVSFNSKILDSVKLDPAAISGEPADVPVEMLLTTEIPDTFLAEMMVTDSEGHFKGISVEPKGRNDTNTSHSHIFLGVRAHGEVPAGGIRFEISTTVTSVGADPSKTYLTRTGDRSSEEFVLTPELQRKGTASDGWTYYEIEEVSADAFKSYQITVTASANGNEVSETYTLK